MESMGTAMAEAAAEIARAREADRERLQGAAREAGGAREWLAVHAPLAVENCPPGLSEAQLAQETTAFYSEAERRLTLCSGCPEGGGACERESAGFAPGEQPVWTDGDEPRLVRHACEKWREYEIRGRLGACGVPPHAAGMVLSTYPGEQEAIDAVVQFYYDATAGNPAWLVLQGPHSTGKTHLSCATLRNAKVNHPRARLRYANAARIEAALKAFYDNSRELPDPLAPFLRADIAVLDNFDPGRMAQWLQKRLADALLARWEDQRATIVTTRESNMRTFVAALPELTGFGDVPVLKLSRVR